MFSCLQLQILFRSSSVDVLFIDATTMTYRLAPLLRFSAFSSLPHSDSFPFSPCSLPQENRGFSPFFHGFLFYNFYDVTFTGNTNCIHSKVPASLISCGLYVGEKRWSSTLLCSRAPKHMPINTLSFKRFLFSFNSQRRILYVEICFPYSWSVVSSYRYFHSTFPYSVHLRL